MLKVGVINGNLAVKLEETPGECVCLICGKELNPSLGYCEDCVKDYMEYFLGELQCLAEAYPDLKLVAKGPNIIIRHKYGEEMYL
jgi:hypothetical protein